MLLTDVVALIDRHKMLLILLAEEKAKDRERLER